MFYPGTYIFRNFAQMHRHRFNHIIYHSDFTLSFNRIVPFAGKRLYAFSNPKDFNK
jgi:hypothetical protein